MADTTTTNYGLTKPDPLSQYNVGVFNGNADIIDTQLKAVDGKIAAVVTTAAALDAGYGDLTGTDYAPVVFQSSHDGKRVDLHGILRRTGATLAVPANVTTPLFTIPDALVPTSDMQFAVATAVAGTNRVCNIVIDKSAKKVLAIFGAAVSLTNDPNTAINVNGVGWWLP